MDPSGWIPREQIRGDEVRGKTLLTKTDSSFFIHDYKWKLFKAAPKDLRI